MKRILLARDCLQRHAGLVLFLGSLVLIAMIFVRGKQLGMHQIIHARLSWYAFPGAISMKYHRGAPYVAYTEIQDRMMTSHTVFRDEEALFKDKLVQHFSNQTIQKAIETPLRHPEETRLFPGDDKGLVDIVLLAFLLFGPTIQAVYYTTILILLLTVAAFFLDCWRRPEQCLLALLILGGIYAGMPALVLTQELYSFTNPRVFEVLGLIPLAHLIVVMMDRQGFSWIRLLALLFQVLVMVECVHVRCTAMWLAITVIGLYLAVLAIRFMGCKGRAWFANAEFRATLRNGWVVGLLLAGLGGLKVYQRLVYHPGYRTTHLQHRVVWHNIGIGLALSPKLARVYDLKLNDGSMIDLVRREVLAHRGQEGIEAIWGKPGEHYHVGEIVKNFQAYEEEARKIVLQIVRKHPARLVQLLFYYKPLLAVRSIGWALGLSEYDVQSLYLYDQSVSLPEPNVAASRNLHIRIQNLCWIGLVLSVACLVFQIPTQALCRYAGLFLLIFFVSFLPAMSTYPVLHVLGAGIVVFAVFLLALVVLIVTSGVRMLAGGMQIANRGSEGGTRTAQAA